MPISAPNDEKKAVKDGIYARDEVEAGVKSALNLIERENPDKIITIGGNCIVSLAPFDYPHGKYGVLASSGWTRTQTSLRRKTATHMPTLWCSARY